MPAPKRGELLYRFARVLEREKDVDAVVGLRALFDLRCRLRDLAVEVVDQHQQTVKAAPWRLAQFQRRPETARPA